MLGFGEPASTQPTIDCEHIEHNRVDMLKKPRIVGVVVSAAACLSGCGGIMPGMQNLDTSQMQKVVVAQKVQVHPTLIPITPSLLVDQHITTY